MYKRQVVEHDVAAGQRSDSFFRYLVVLYVSWHQGIYRIGVLDVYKRQALYGIDFLIEEKKNDLANMGDREMIDEVIRLREEVSMQIKALKGLKEMAQLYGYDISQPAKNAREAVQWLYFGYLGAVDVYKRQTWNNAVHNTVWNIKDDVTYYLGKHKIIAGLNYEHQMADNAYQRNGCLLYTSRCV